MRSVYEDKRIPLQIRRLLIFINICRKAKNNPDQIAFLSDYSKLAFGVQYLQGSRRYIAYGSVFEYAHTRAQVVEQGVNKLPHDEYVMCSITVKKQAFTKAVRTPFELLINWNKCVKNGTYKCVDDHIESFFKVNDELEMDYLPHKYDGRLVAVTDLPLWDDKTFQLNF